MTAESESVPVEFARRLRAYMGYADRTLEDVAADLRTQGIEVSASTVQRWARGRVAPDVYAARALGRLVESARIAPVGRGAAWLLGEEEPGPEADDVRELLAGAHFHTTGRDLADALGEGRLPTAYRRPLARLLARLLTELDEPRPRGPPGTPDAPPDQPDA
ncbi:MAG: hypothetical protein FJ029_14020 [Actinobacteria bacterium]|nr:hypothetical protein [Actinomycetota bacterium]